MKETCFIFYQHSDYALIVENAQQITADDFMDEEDIHIVDKNFTWTFVKTHERACGPYFKDKNNI
jgi:hypothetical protein